MLIGACTLGAPRLAHAGPSEASAAQALFDDAKALMNEGNYRAACPKLEESQRLDPALGTLLNLADCREKEGNVATAWSVFREAEGLAKREGHAEAQEVARARGQALFARVPRLLVEVAAGQPRGFRLTRNEIEVGVPQWGAPIPIDPGAYEIVATAPGYREFRATATLEDGGGTVTISVPLLAPRATPSSAATANATLASDPALAESSGGSIPTASWILGGVGIAAIGTSLGLGAWAKSEYDGADCPEHACTGPDQLEQRNAARTKATAATVVFIAGTAAFLGGVTIWALTPRDAAPSVGVRALELRAGIGSVGLSGAW